MPARDLPGRPNLEQYKKQAKELLDGCRAADPDAVRRMRAHVRGASDTAGARRTSFALADAQFVIAREHGFESWPRFARHIETLNQARSAGPLTDPATAFIEAASVPREAHASGTLEYAQMILARHPQVARSSIHAAALLAALTRLLLERGADPNDEETPYHVPETTDNTVMRIFLESGRLNADSLATMLLRKADWHDPDGVRLLLEHGADPNRLTRWGRTALHQAILRDNAAKTIALLLEHGADPSLPDAHGRTAVAVAARRGRGAVLMLLQHGRTPALAGVDRLIAACALDDRETIRASIVEEPALRSEVVRQGGTLLAEFAGVGNTAGVRNLLDCGVSPAALYEGDSYFGIASHSTALHVAAWRAWPDVVKELIARGTPVNATDGRGRTPLALAVRACVDSYWTERRSPESVKALLDAGASVAGVEMPSGYDEVDALLRGHVEAAGPAQ
jgi:ankyrin repeat protein